MPPRSVGSNLGFYVGSDVRPALRFDLELDPGSAVESDFRSVV